MTFSVSYKEFFDPFSKKLNACELFREIKNTHKTITLLITAISSIFLIYPGIVAFRALTHTFYQIEKEELEKASAIDKTNEIGIEVIAPKEVEIVSAARGENGLAPRNELSKEKFCGEDISTKSWFRTDHISFYMNFLAKQPGNENILFDFIEEGKKPDIFQKISRFFQWNGDNFSHMLKEHFKGMSYDDNWNSVRGAAFVCNIKKRHWVLLYVCRETRSVEYYDSMKNYADPLKIEASLAEIAEQLTQQDPGEPYQFSQKIREKLQTDAWNCGPWVLYFLKERLGNPNNDFNDLEKVNMDDYRNYLKETIIKEVKEQYEEIEANKSSHSAYKQTT